MTNFESYCPPLRDINTLITKGMLSNSAKETETPTTPYPNNHLPFIFFYAQPLMFKEKSH